MERSEATLFIYNRRCEIQCISSLVCSFSFYIWGSIYGLTMCDQISCDDLCTELMQAADRIKASGNAELDDAHESLYRSWVGRLSALQSQPTPTNIRKLTSAICQGPWTTSQQDELIGIITSIKEKRAKKQARRKSQTCLSFENMISVGGPIANVQWSP